MTLCVPLKPAETRGKRAFAADFSAGFPQNLRIEKDEA
jgi:hypothetical protein